MRNRSVFLPCGIFCLAAISYAQPVLTLPAGVTADRFRITTFATGLSFPTSIAILPDKSLLVGVTEGTPIEGDYLFGSGGLVRLSDPGNTGAATFSARVYSGLPKAVQSVRLIGTDLVAVAQFGTGTGQIAFLRIGADPNATYTNVGVIKLVSTRTDADIYISMDCRPTPGSPGYYDLFFSGNNSVPEAHTIAVTGLASGNMPTNAMAKLRINPAPSIPTFDGFQLLSVGLRNPGGITYHGATGDLYVNDNGEENGSTQLAYYADELNRVGAASLGVSPIDFGWPLNNSEYRTGRMTGVTGVPPLVAFQPFPDPNTGIETVGISEMAVAPELFPAELNNGLFMAFYGNWEKSGPQNFTGPILYYNFATGQRTVFASSGQSGIGHYTAMAASADTLYFGDISSNGVIRTSQAPLGVIYQIQVKQSAAIASPASGTRLPRNAVFSWTPVSGASGYWLDVGTSPGQGNICASGELAAGTTSFNCNNITESPAAATIYVQLWTKSGGVWNAPRQYTYLPPEGNAAITAPAAGTPLAATASFSWTLVSGADGYWLDIGTVAGQGDVCASGPLAAGAATFSCSGIPAGVTIHAQLWTRANGAWKTPPRRYTYPPRPLEPATLTAPAPGTVIPGPAATFTWTSGTGIDTYWLDVGTSKGSGNISAGATTNTAKTVAGLPSGNNTIYVRLWSHQAGGNWLTPLDYTFTTVFDARATLLTPSPGVLPGTTATFTWTPGTGADGYWFDAGPVTGSGAYLAGFQTATSRTVTGLPCTGQPLFVRLWTRIAGVYQTPIDYAFTLPSNCGTGDPRATLTAPAPGAHLPGTAATFTWSPGGTGTTQYWLDVGTSLGSGNLSAGATPSLSRAVTNLPGAGTVYVRLWTYINGAWQTPIDSIFTY